MMRTRSLYLMRDRELVKVIEDLGDVVSGASASEQFL